MDAFGLESPSNMSCGVSQRLHHLNILKTNSRLTQAKYSGLLAIILSSHFPQALSEPDSEVSSISESGTS